MPIKRRGMPIERPTIKGTFLSQELIVAEMVLEEDWVLVLRQGFWFLSEITFKELMRGGSEQL